jgi:hypothetical protein
MATSAGRLDQNVAEKGEQENFFNSLGSEWGDVNIGSGKKKGRFHLVKRPFRFVGLPD